MPPSPSSTLFPYTTLFRSKLGFDPDEVRDADSESAALERLTVERERIGPVNLVAEQELAELDAADRKSTRLNSSHRCISYAVLCLKEKNPGTVVVSPWSWI